MALRRVIGPQTSNRGKIFGALVASGVAIGGLSAVANFVEPPAVQPKIALVAQSEFTLIGHGNGHGRGMGQYGAYGYAKKGWSFSQILAHYYGGTAPGKVNNTEVTVSLNGKSSVTVYADNGLRVGAKTVAPGQAVSVSGTTATIYSGCGGSIIGTAEILDGLVAPLNPAPNRPANEILKFCGSNESFRGKIGIQKGVVVNIVTIDDYAKGVVPKESNASWADQDGLEALKAQAVAARSYALASIDRGKEIDMTQNSQVYGGVAAEDPRTNRAVDETSNVIITKNGRPAFAEFSSSTGGYSDGIDFPAVIDEGDSVSPYNNWTKTISAGEIGSAFGVGAVNNFEVIEANGLGAENGRAYKVRISGSGGTKEVTGNEVRSALGLRSAWFAVQGQVSKPAIVAPKSGVGPAGPTGGLTLPQIPGLPNLNLPNFPIPQLPDLASLIPQGLIPAGLIPGIG